MVHVCWGQRTTPGLHFLLPPLPPGIELRSPGLYKFLYPLSHPLGFCILPFVICANNFSHYIDKYQTRKLKEIKKGLAWAYGFRVQTIMRQKTVIAGVGGHIWPHLATGTRER